MPWIDPLCVQNFTLSLPAPGPTLPTSAVSFPPWVLVIKDEKVIKLPVLLSQERENSYKLQLGRNLASDPPRWTSCFSLPLYPLRFTGASWAIEQEQGPEAWLLKPQSQEPLASRRLVSARQRSRCLYLQASCAASHVCRQRLSGNSRHLKHSVPGPLTTSGWQRE